MKSFMKGQCSEKYGGERQGNAGCGSQTSPATDAYQQFRIQLLLKLISIVPYCRSCVPSVPIMFSGTWLVGKSKPRKFL